MIGSVRRKPCVRQPLAPNDNSCESSWLKYGRHSLVEKVAIIRSFVIAFVLLFAVGCREQPREQASYPRRPIKLIVPFGAGGGSDTFGRIIQNAIEKHELLPQPLVIVNVPGAGGTIGSRRVKNAMPDGYTLLLLHEGILTAKHSGQATYGPEAFAPIVGTGDATQVVAVAGDSPFVDLRSLMESAAEHPDTLVFSANIGAPSHFAGLMLEAEQPGAKFRYTQNGGGAKRFAALQGGHVDVSAFSIAEYTQFRESGMRALALLGPERHPDLEELATAREQGFDVISQNMQFWWAPLGTAEERLAVIAGAVESAMQTPQVRQKLVQMKMASTTLRGNDLRDEIEKRDGRIASVATAEIPPLPNFPMVALGCLIALAIIATVRARQRRNTDEKENSRSLLGAESPRFAWMSAFTVAYVAFLQLGWVSFVPATAIYAILCGATLVRRSIAFGKVTWPRAGATVGVMAIAMSFALHHVFTKILVVDLP